MIEPYNIAGVDFPYTKEGFSDENKRRIEGKRVTLTRDGHLPPVKVTIKGFAGGNVDYIEEDTSRRDSCHWMSFWKRQVEGD